MDSGIDVGTKTEAVSVVGGQICSILSYSANVGITPEVIIKALDALARGIKVENISISNCTITG